MGKLFQFPRASDRYRVAIYNHAAGCGYTGYGRTRRAAFNHALRRAGEPWLRAGSDKLTTLRTLFAENIMSPWFRTAPHGSAMHPIGCGVEFWRLDAYPGFRKGTGTTNVC